MNKETKKIKSPLLPEHGTFMYGKLDELDFTKKGSGTTNSGEPISWGHSVKLKFISTKMVEKELMGEIIRQPKTVFEYMTIACDSEDEIQEKYSYFQSFIGQEILVPIVNNQEKTTYKIDDGKLMIIDNKAS
ncbi:hypothetical protein [Halarcobacter sp.]|uniref:hypothetical protein n=1 Tax=Halarcobacter sp. TaxID=2321133 RepID=UPI002AAB64B1|nr:hypothetical protein [Halarcobacter sp.]